MIAATPILFRYGEARRGAEPLALLGGSLILDSGEADQSFLLRCQDRFVTYAWLLGLRPILFAEDAATARQTADAVARLRADCAAVAQACGLPGLFRAVEPLILGCDPFTATVFPLPMPALAGHAVFHLNQVSPTAARLVKGVAAILADQGIGHGLDSARLDADARRALELHDKRVAIAIARTCPDTVPRMLATGVIDAADLAGLKDWQALQSLYRARTGEAAPDALVVKSARASGGNLAAILSHANFAEGRRQILEAFVRATGNDAHAALAEIRSDIAGSRLDPAAYPDARLAAFARLRRERCNGLSLLVQRFVPPARSTWAQPASLGLSLHIGDDGVRTLAVNAQTYHDAERRHFRGALLDRRIEAAFAGSRFEAQMRNLAAHFGASGYRGPIGFDALRDTDGDYVLIHDCNPRLSAVLPALAVRRALRPGPRSVLSLGYRGEARVPHLPAALAALDSVGLLYGARDPSGLLPLPSMVGPGRCDLVLIDAPLSLLDEAAAVLEAVGVQAAISSAIPGLPAE